MMALAYFSSLDSKLIKLKAQTDTLICDNGGFESGFDYYFGYVATPTYFKGSDNCTPVDLSNNPVVWTSSSLPSFRRFEIVTSGLDTLVGINRTKFGSKALLLNNRYGQTGNPCSTYFDINKIVKRFRVTEENRDFTVWFAAVLENPASHTDQQPFFSIECDRAHDYDLCFDASLIECQSSYSDSLCSFETIKVVNWTCHRIKIPKNMVDSIATLEITAADCGERAHFGYAYVDGICEECDGSAMGSATLYNHPIDINGLGINYNGCSDTITFCGSYTLPTICGTWKLDSIKALGYIMYNLTIDTTNYKFCFDLPISDFSDYCKDFYVTLYFSSNVTILPPTYSNSIYICPDDYAKYEVEVNTGSCQDNNTSDLLSDDYYYVQVILSHMHGDTFTIERKLDDPYPNESGQYVIKADTGDGTFNLGPFYIQEGSWKLIVKFENCSDTFNITPPYFCSSDCNKFYRTTINNITCNNHGTTTTISDDTWTFDIDVQGTSGTYNITGVASGLNYNTTYTINVPGTIGLECKEFVLHANQAQLCESKIIVCPPKPCSDSRCNLEINLKEVSCSEDDMYFYIEVDTSNVGSGYLCFQSFAFNDPGNTSNANYYSGTFSNPFGPFTASVYFIFSICSTSACSCDPTCYKLMYFPKPDCDNLDYRTNTIIKSDKETISELMVIPNPIHSNEMILKSSLKNTIYEFYNSSLNLIYSGSFSGSEYKLTLEIPSGLNYVRYKNSIGKYNYIKVIKL